MRDYPAILPCLTLALLLTTGCDHFHTPAVPFGPAGSIAVAVRSSDGEVATWFGGGEPPEIETCLYDIERDALTRLPRTGTVTALPVAAPSGWPLFLGSAEWVDCRDCGPLRKWHTKIWKLEAPGSRPEFIGAAFGAVMAYEVSPDASHVLIQWMDCDDPDRGDAHVRWMIVDVNDHTWRSLPNTFMLPTWLTEDILVGFEVEYDEPVRKDEPARVPVVVYELPGGSFRRVTEVGLHQWQATGFADTTLWPPYCLLRRSASIVIPDADGEKGPELVRINLLTAERHALVRDGRHAFFPTPSPSGRRIAYTDCRDLNEPREQHLRVITDAGEPVPIPLIPALPGSVRFLSEDRLIYELEEDHLLMLDIASGKITDLSVKIRRRFTEG